MVESSRIFVAGHTGLAGSAICRELLRRGYPNLIVRTHAELDLCDQSSVNAFFQAERPEFVFLAAARVGGIIANTTRPADFIRDNLLIQTNVIESAWRFGSAKLLFLGSSCIYPRLAPQPIREEYLLTGELEPTNAPYAIAKIAGISMVDAYNKQYGFPGISLMPTNLYGPGDNFDLQSSHVLPALIRKFHEAFAQGKRSVTVWGSGKPRREFLHVDDFASAAVFVMKHWSGPGFINAGTGKDIEIAELARMVAEVVGYTGKIEFDTSKPDGTPRKLLDVSRLTALGWRPTISLREGITQTYRWYVDQAGAIRAAV
jgi:GDP-L-fucose synthase